MKSTPWQRFFGSGIADGTDSLTVRGAMNLDWANTPVVATRLSMWSSPSDGYEITVLGLDGDYQHCLAFTTRDRPRPGAYQLERYTLDVPPVGRYRVGLSLGPDEGWIGGVDVGFEADSGRLMISAAKGGLDGSYVVFMSGIPPGGSKTRGTIVVRGKFHLDP